MLSAVLAKLVKQPIAKATTATTVTTVLGIACDGLTYDTRLCNAGFKNFPV